MARQQALNNSNKKIPIYLYQNNQNLRNGRLLPNVILFEVIGETIKIEILFHSFLLICGALFLFNSTTCLVSIHVPPCSCSNMVHRNLSGI